MIISNTLKYVYIGIPRTGSKSMNRWLKDNYEGESFGFHHQWQVPEEAKDYLIFTIVRNPYERMASMRFMMAWDGEEPREDLRKQKPPSGMPTISLEEQVREVTLYKDGTLKKDGTSVPENGMNQWFYAQRAEVSMVLFFERLPECLKDLPFVDGENLPNLPHALERGIRPPGSFFDHSGEDDETVVWAYGSEDFESFGYRRFEPSLPEKSPNSLIIT